jgi:hypothetical protein
MMTKDEAWRSGCQTFERQGVQGSGFGSTVQWSVQRFPASVASGFSRSPPCSVLARMSFVWMSASPPKAVPGRFPNSPFPAGFFCLRRRLVAPTVDNLRLLVFDGGLLQQPYRRPDDCQCPVKAGCYVLARDAQSRAVIAGGNTSAGDWIGRQLDQSDRDGAMNDRRAVVGVEIV